MYVCTWQCFQWPFSANCNDKKETYTKDKAAYYHIMTYNNIDKQKEIVFCTCQGVANTTVYCETNLCKMYSITCHIFLRKSYLLVLIVISNTNTYLSLIVFVYNWLYLDINTRIINFVECGKVMNENFKLTFRKILLFFTSHN